MLAAYRTEGPAFVSRLAGRFAVAVADAAAARVVLAIDPMGIERLAFATAPGLLVFGTSPRPSPPVPASRPAFRARRSSTTSCCTWCRRPDTIYRRRPQAARRTHGRLERWPRRSDAVVASAFVESRGAVAAALKADLHPALRPQSPSCAPDATHGAFLERRPRQFDRGGRAQPKCATEPIDTFSIGFGYPEFDELSYARIANQRFGCRGHEHTITGDDIADAFPLIARAYDEPFGNSSALPLYYCARLARAVWHGSPARRRWRRRAVRGQQPLCAPERLRALRAAAAICCARACMEPLLAALPDALRIRPFRRASAFIGRANVPLPGASRDLEPAVPRRRRRCAAAGFPRLDRPRRRRWPACRRSGTRHPATAS